MTLRARWAVALVVPVVAVTLAGCASPRAGAPTTTSTTSSVPATTSTSAASATTTPATTAPSTTTVALPSALQTSAQAAATVLVNAWAANNRSRALLVAVPQAVDTLFAARYPAGLAISRGCTSAFPPIICTYGPPGGGPTNAPIYQIHVTPASGGWYVSSVQVES
ncbi:MAG TPA: hypothetical protein VLZ77_16200 [Acidimicrobiales bacterium]|nr:hypothetical protein [Acidimicrobiales bacterium]